MNSIARKFFSTVVCLAALTGCAKAKNGQSAEVKKDPRLEKLDYIYASMSDRFKQQVSFSDDQDKLNFLTDLDKVLDAQEKFPKDDLSLYYLIDKKHNVGRYVPSKLVPLVQNEYYNISRNDLSLRPDVEAALVEMAKGAKQDGITLLVSSTYRSYDYQEKLFEKWVRIDGLEEAERESARAGTSQHQLGQAIDFGSIEDSFIETAQGKWLNQNSERYGWSLSFPQGYEDVTGYRWECWHFRYIGIPACEFQKKWFGDVQQFMLEFIDAWQDKV